MVYVWFRGMAEGEYDDYSKRGICGVTVPGWRFGPVEIGGSSDDRDRRACRRSRIYLPVVQAGYPQAGLFSRRVAQEGRGVFRGCPCRSHRECAEARGAFRVGPNGPGCRRGLWRAWAAYRPRRGQLFAVIHPIDPNDLTSRSTCTKIQVGVEVVPISPPRPG
jgi:hypothetical protein